MNRGRRLIVRGVAGLLLALVTTACQVEISIGAQVAADGSGVFALTIGADEDLVASRDPEIGLAPITGLFDGLAAKGWSVAKSEPDGGLRITATRPFADAADLERVLDELRSARTSPDAGDLGSVDLSFAIDQEPGFVSTRTQVRASIDTSALDALGSEIVAELRRLVTFRIEATLPRAPIVHEGAASVVGNTVIWEPQLGEAVVMRASSVRRSAGAFMGIVFGAISAGLFIAAAVARAGRRRRQRARDAGFSALDPLDVKRPEEPESAR